MNTRNQVLEIVERLAAAGCRMPHPDSLVCSERMLNLSALFDFIGNIAAAGCFKSMAAEVAELEREAASFRQLLAEYPTGYDEYGVYTAWKEKADRSLTGAQP